MKVGDQVQSFIEAKTAPIWIGLRTVDCKHHPDPRQVWPVRISAGAFGPGLPAGDLFLSPDHAVYVDEILIPAKPVLTKADPATITSSLPPGSERGIAKQARRNTDCHGLSIRLDQALF
jgi:Hint domain